MICISIADVDTAEAIELMKKCEMAEVRLDRMEFTDRDVEKLFSSSISTIATYRPGENTDDNERLRILKMAISSGADLVDVEVENSDEFKNEIIETARLKKCTVIISYHDYSKTPVLRELEQIVEWCYSSGGDIAKIACQANTAQDSARLLSLYNSDKPLIAIGMGEMGRITRISAPLLGAPFTYGSIDESKKTAPGQIESGKLKTIIDLIRS